jgi:hypothetical protein
MCLAKQVRQQAEAAEAAAGDAAVGAAQLDQQLAATKQEVRMLLEEADFSKGFAFLAVCVCAYLPAALVMHLTCPCLLVAFYAGWLLG